MKLTVIIPTYNPDKQRFEKVLESLRQQTLSAEHWELIIIDNNSNNNILQNIDISLQKNAYVVKEARQGLTYSRITGFTLAKGEVIVMVDDDNILAPNYLEQVNEIFFQNTKLGSAGGIIEGEFDGYQPPRWANKFMELLAIRNFGPEVKMTGFNGTHPPFAPVGAGMAIRRSALEPYIQEVNNASSIITDRSGTSLSSGGDNEINISLLKNGYSVGYFPQLRLKHIIPPGRLTKSYLARLNHQSSASWAKLLLKHGMSPWEKISPLSVGLRKLKSWFTCRAFLSSENYIMWRGTCGMFEGLADE